MAAGAATGAAIAVGGPVGSLVGGAIGAVAGAATGNAVANTLEGNTEEDNYWRTNYTTSLIIITRTIMIPTTVLRMTMATVPVITLTQRVTSKVLKLSYVMIGNNLKVNHAWLGMKPD